MIIALLFLIMYAVPIVKAEELHTIYLPIVLDEMPNLGAHVWAERHIPFVIDGAINYVPVYPHDAKMTYHETIMPQVIGHPVVLGFRNVRREWRSGELECLPPLPEYYDDYANEIALTVSEYVTQGHNIVAVELWNEPEPFPEQVGAEMAHYYGCWGDTEQSGAQYAALSREVYPKIKTIDERLKVLGGALLFGSPHELPPFWQGAINAGVYDHLDVVTFHSYSGWPTNNFDLVLAKADLLRQSTDKPLWITETSLLCVEDCGAQFEADQAAYFRYLMQDASDHGIDTVIWFMSGWNGWRNSDLVRQDYTKKPVYYEFEKYFIHAH